MSVVVFLVSALRSPSMGEFLTGLENSDWLRHIKSIMEAGIFISKVKDLFESSSALALVLISCSHVHRPWQRKGSASWFIVLMAGIGRLRCALWPVCFWILTAGPSRD